MITSAGLAATQQSVHVQKQASEMAPTTDADLQNASGARGVVSSVYSWFGSLFGRNESLASEQPPSSVGANEFQKAKLSDDLALLSNLVHPEQELADEPNDGEVFQAVWNSMTEWHLQKIQRQSQQK